jgi:cysteinyl-tRNA synthetase, unknown class
MRRAVPVLLLALLARAGDDDAAARLARANDWAYQLQDLDLAQARASAFDVLVTDPTRDGTDATAWTRDEVAQLREGGRVALAYLSVGEAEDYRGYWRPEWRARPPAWLGPENPEWKGNHLVRFWDPAWRALLLAEDGPLLRLVEAGWDGVYLDRVDVWEDWVARGELDRADAMDRMAAFVRELAAAARARRPGFLVVQQNAPDLAVRPDVLEVLSGLGLEDTFFWDERQRPPAEVDDVLALARRVRAAGRPVLCVDYCRALAAVARFHARARAEGLVPYATVRALDRLVVDPGFEPD